MLDLAMVEKKLQLEAIGKKSGSTAACLVNNCQGRDAGIIVTKLLSSSTYISGHTIYILAIPDEVDVFPGRISSVALWIDWIHW